MIILGEKNEDVNVLHVIIGPETEFQFNLSGQSVIDISEYIANYKTGDKCMLVVNRCESEEDLISGLNYYRAKDQAQSMMSQFASQLKDGITPKATDQKTTKESKKNHHPACPKCSAPHSATVIDGTSYPCETCQKIDQGIQKGDIPGVPHRNDLDKIKKDIEQENPHQKKSSFKFFKNNTTKNDKKDKK